MWTLSHTCRCRRSWSGLLRPERKTSTSLCPIRWLPWEHSGHPRFLALHRPTCWTPPLSSPLGLKQPYMEKSHRYMYIHFKLAFVSSLICRNEKCFYYNELLFLTVPVLCCMAASPYVSQLSEIDQTPGTPGCHFE